MEITAQTVKVQTLIGLNDLLAECESNTLAANLMSEDLLNFFEEANHADPADKPLYMIYLPEHEIRAHILQEYISRANTGLQKLYEQTLSLIDALRQESA